MVLHLFPVSKFTESFIGQIRACFPASEHPFIVYGVDDALTTELQKYENVHFCKTVSKISIQKESSVLLKAADKIVLHGLYSYSLLIALIQYHKKTCLVFWGGDIYEMQNPAASVKQKLIRIMKKRYIHSLHSVATLLEGDYNVLGELCRPPKRHYVVQYSRSRARIQKYDEIRNLVKPSNPYVILVGNSAADENNHFKAFQILAKFKDENIKLLLPLSYGATKERVQEIVKCAKEIFGDKVEPLYDLMPPNDYAAVLNNCSVGLFNHNRQQAMGNINILAYMGGKVYIRTDTVMWDAFVGKFGLEYYDIDSIASQTFEEFIHIDKETAEHNYTIRKQLDSVTHFKEVWDKLFKGEMVKNEN